MSESFTKLFSTITDSSVWAESSDVRIVWVTLLAMADRHGYIGASVPGLANRARVSVEVVEEALVKFMAPDPYSRSEEHEGRRLEKVERGWQLLNYQRFREVADSEVRRKQKRDWWRENRGKGAHPPPDEDDQTRPTPSSDVELDESRHKQIQIQIRSRSDLDPDQDADADPDRARARGSDGAILDSLETKAGRIQKNPYDATFDEPKEWPEVRRVAEKLHEAAKLGPIRLGSFAQDRGIQALVACFGAGYTEFELLRAAELLPKSDWWTKDGKKRGLSSMTCESVRIVLVNEPAPGYLQHVENEKRPAKLDGLVVGQVVPRRRKPEPPMTAEEIEAALAKAEAALNGPKQREGPEEERERWRRDLEAELEGKAS